MARSNFRDTGIPSSVSHANSNGGLLVAAPGVGKHVMICDVLSSAQGSLNVAQGSGTTICYLTTGGISNFSAPIKVPENSAVYASTGYVTITYFIVDTN